MMCSIAMLMWFILTCKSVAHGLLPVKGEAFANMNRYTIIITSMRRGVGDGAYHFRDAPGRRSSKAAVAKAVGR